MHRHLAIIWIALLCFALPALGATIPVSDDDCTIEEAILSANTDSGQGGCEAGSGADTIVLPAGKFLISQGHEIIGDVSFVGQGQDNTIIDGQNGDYRFIKVSGSVSLSGLTISRFNTKSHIAPLEVNEGSELNLLDVTIRKNEGVVGAISTDGYVSVSASTITDNISTRNANNVTPTGHLLLHNSSVVNNTTTGGGGTILCLGTMQITRSTISTNMPRIGGVISTTGFTSARGSVQILSSTIAFNKATERGTGGIDDGGTVTMRNSILANNWNRDGKEANCDGELNSGGYNILHNVQGCNIIDRSDTDRDEDPMLDRELRALGGTTLMHRPLPGSPAINNGAPDDFGMEGSCPRFDQRHLRRLGPCDIGAVEVGAALVVFDPTHLGPGDQEMEKRLKDELAFETVRDTLTDTPATAGKNLVIISESAPSAVAGKSFRNIPVPVLVIEPQAFDEMYMTGANPDDFGVSPGQESVWIKTKRRMTADLIGKVTTTKNAARYAFGRTLATGAKCLAWANESSTRCMIFRIGKGQSLFNRMRAPARRVGFFSVGETFTDLTADGLRLFDGSVLWAAQGESQ